MRRSHRCPAVLLLTIALLIAAPPRGRAFEVLRHSNMTGEVLARQGAGPNTLKFIQQGVRWPDLTQCLSGCYCPAYLQIFCSDPDSAQVIEFSKSHYDNNQILESMDNVETLMTLARSWVNRTTPPANDEERRMLGTALIFFGEALHAIQDFYSHSTWIELNRDLIRIGGHLYSCPMWNGETTGGSGSTVVGGITVAGVQTGYVDIAPPAGSVTHGALNKDAPGTTQGQIVVNRIFPVTRIGSYYEIASGQVGGSFNSYTDDGLAPRHTIKALQCLFSGCAIYNLPPIGAEARAGVPVSEAERASLVALLGSNPMLSWLEADPTMTAIATHMDSIWVASDPDTPSTFPLANFDPDGWPLPPSTSVEDLFRPDVRVLQAVPNPFRGRTAVRFRAPSAGPVRLEVFDLGGRRLRTLLDRELEPGWKEVWWAGLDERGVALPAGTYLVRLTGFGRRESARLTLVR
jgi:hypothetical protein